MRTKKKYANSQKRGGTPGKATDSGCPAGRHAKDYHRVAVAFHGGEMALDKWKNGGMKGYVQ